MRHETRAAEGWSLAAEPAPRPTSHEIAISPVRDARLQLTHSRLFPARGYSARLHYPPFRRSGDPMMGDFSDAIVIRAFGEVPDKLDEL